jgi:hypothetical protein
MGFGSMTNAPTFIALMDTLSMAMERHGVRDAEPCYLFDGIDDVPDGMPSGILEPLEQWTDSWCEPCATSILQTACKAGIADDEVDIHFDDGCGEGPHWCTRCGVYLREGFTSYSIEMVLIAWKGQRLTPDCLPEIVEGLEYYGDGLPFICTTCRYNAPLRRGWKAPQIHLDLSRWWETAFVAVEMPCCGCTHTVWMETRKANEAIQDVERWKQFRHLARRAYRHFHAEEEDAHA